MKSCLLMGCAAVAAVFMTAGTASAQCGYGGGFGGGYYGGGSRISVGYSSFAPRSSFSIGYNSYPSYRTSYRNRGHYDWHPASRQRSRFNVGPSPWDLHRGRRW